MEEPPALKPAYKRVVLKLSGVAFGHAGKPGINVDETLGMARQIARLAASGLELAVVVGGGNILRGSEFSAHGQIMKETTAHHMGMIATVLNGLALQATLEAQGVETRLQTALRMDTVAEPYIQRRAVRHLEKKRVVILAGGTGNPFVTTDSAAATRSRELEANVLLKATRVDGVYSDDPEVNPHAVLYDRLTYQDILTRNLRVLDTQAVATCREGKVPILIFNFKRPGNIERAVAGQAIGTLIKESF